MGEASPPFAVSRYVLYDEIARGGMARVHIGRLRGPVGFARTVAIKRLHQQLASDPHFVQMFLDEARLAARLRHPNVVGTIDVVTGRGELLLVMEFVPGLALSWLLKSSVSRGQAIPVRIAVTLMIGVLEGLNAAHEATSEQGEPLEIVHRDMSPQNIMVGVDGVPRVVDFGIAKASVRDKRTLDGQLKGKLRYMAPEQLRSQPIDRRTDIFALGIVLWEMLTGFRLFKTSDPMQLLELLANHRIEPPSRVVPGLPYGIDAVVMRALELEKERRFATARDMAQALEQLMPLATQREIGAWVEQVGGEELRRLLGRVREIESQFVASEVEQFEDQTESHLLGPVTKTFHPPAVDPIKEPELPTHLYAAASASESESLRLPAPPQTERVSRRASRPAPSGGGIARWLPWAVAIGSTLCLVVVAVAVLSANRATSSPPSVVSGASLPSSAPSRLALPIDPPPPQTSSEVAKPVVTETVKRTQARVEAAKPRPGCNPPYVVDAGIKFLKLECM